MPIRVFDFFSGCGGTSAGFRDAGMLNTFALDIDADSAKTFCANFPGVPFLRQDISQVPTEHIRSLVEACGNDPLLFCGCAPCQPFTKQRTNPKQDDVRVPLLGEFQRFVDHYRPEYVFVENVPGLQKVWKSDGIFQKFTDFLKASEYSVAYGIVASQGYGVPQQRRRLVLIASRVGEIKLPEKTHGAGTNNLRFSSVRDWIGYLPPIAAGEAHLTIADHRAACLAPINLERISVTPAGCGRESWLYHLQLECHKTHVGHTDVYGRMRWDEPASGLTTRCISLSNGRFGHPEQNRAISVREAACLQTFPESFVFHGNLNSKARQIGNAVPVKLAEVFGRHFVEHMQQNVNGENNMQFLHNVEQTEGGIYGAL
jgi:DNA (cytosine-5)-methyltransferase 1